MKISNLKYLLAIGTILTVGCNKQLDQTNPNAQTSATYWQTSTDAVKGVNACYQMFLEDGGYMRFTPILLNIQGDDVRSQSPWTSISNVGKLQLGTDDEAGYGWCFD